MTKEKVQFPIGVVIGKDGKSAYQVACDNEFDGTEEEWLESLKANIIVDTELSDTSTNSVQNKVVTSKINQMDIDITSIRTGANGAFTIANEAKAIAKGKATGYVFDTEADMIAWLANQDNASNLVQGDNLYIRDINVPDYWWDGTKAQQLETQKVDLAGYATEKYVDDKIKDVEPAYTPQKGIDYWTEADKNEIKEYVDEAILGGAW